MGDRQTVSFKHQKPVESVRKGNSAKPWSLRRENDREKKLDRLATEIMAAEAMKLINKAYEVVF